MIEWRTLSLNDMQVQKLTPFEAGRQLSWRNVIAGWQTEEAFRDSFIKALQASPFSGYFWECQPLLRNDLDKPFECVLANCPRFDSMRASSSAFSKFFASAEPQAGAVSFDNLSGDALLIAPTPQGPASAYSHLAAFSAHAPHQQQHQFWQMVGEAIDDHLDEDPIWISTNGLGVPWLHVRLDIFPKYITYEPYGHFP